MKNSRHLIFGSIIIFTSLIHICQFDQRETDRHTAHFENLLQKGDFAEYIQTAKKSPFYSGSRNKLLYNMDTGIAEVFLGDYNSGTKKLIRALNQSEKYYTKSISRQVLSVLTNDLTLPYYGEDYEVTFAGNIAALAFAGQGKTEDALVEIRRGEHRLSVMSDTYDGTNKYSDDAFTHYLAGIIYEITGEYNDSLVSYKLAEAAYGGRFFPMKPAGLSQALHETSEAAGISPDGALHLNPAELPENRTVMAVAAFAGRGPVKNEVIMRAHFTDNGIDHIVKLAIPVIKSRKSSIRAVRLTIDDMNYPVDLAADYNIIGKSSFNDRKNLIYARTLARVSTRYLIINATKKKTVEKLTGKYEKIKEKHGENSDEADRAWFKLKTASIALDLLANELLEHADTRCSLMLPERVFLSRIPVSPGKHTIVIEYLGQAGNVIDSEAREIEVTTDSRLVEMFTALY